MATETEWERLERLLGKKHVGLLSILAHAGDEIEQLRTELELTSDHVDRLRVRVEESESALEVAQKIFDKVLGKELAKELAKELVKDLDK